jgi:hypothetical protein
MVPTTSQRRKSLLGIKKKIKNKPTFKCNKKIVGNINYDFHKGERKEF